MQANRPEIALNVYALLFAPTLIVFALVAPFAVIDVGRSSLVALTSLIGLAGAYLLLGQVSVFTTAFAARRSGATRSLVR